MRVVLLVISLLFTDSFAANIDIHTGSKTGTYYRFGNDIKNILEDSNIKISVKSSTGSVENIKQLSADAKGVSFAIVQSDVMSFLKKSKSKNISNLASKLSLIFPFYQEEVHILVNENIDSLQDLNNKIIAVGAVGSGSWLTSNNILNIASVKPDKMLRTAPEESVLAVLSGRADAAFIVAGQPVRLFKNIDELSQHKDYSKIIKGVKFLSIKNQKVLAEYRPTIIKAGTYDFVKKDVKTVGVLSMLVAFNENNKKACSVIGNFSALMRDKIHNLKSFGHKKWLEVELDSEVSGWNANKCASQKSDITNFENELLNF